MRSEPQSPDEDEPETPHSERPPTGTTTFIDRRQLAHRWATSMSTIKRMEKRGEITPIRLGKRITRFRMTDIVKIEENP